MGAAPIQKPLHFLFKAISVKETTILPAFLFRFSVATAGA
jgi:hypothetical protein